MHGRTRPEPIPRSASDAQREALFVSALQPSDTPTAEMIARAILSAIRRFGPRGCAARMAQEFGDHPEAAAARMRWARQVTAQQSTQGDVMLETCDRCGPAVRAAYIAVRTGQLFLCGHCAAQLRPALRAKGWTIWPIGDGSPAQPAAA